MKKTRAGKTKKITTTRSSEHEEQCKFFQYVRLKKTSDSIYKNIFAVPNGGYRAKSTAVKMQAEGQEAGVPDIFVAIPRGKFHGLFIEMKVGYNKPTEKQEDWLHRLLSLGYKCVLAYSGESAIAALEAYLALT